MTGCDAALLAGADLLVLRSLELVGKRLLSRELRGVLQDVPPALRYRMIVAQPGDFERLMGGSFDHLPHLVEEHGCGLVDAQVLEACLGHYVRGLLITREPHRSDELRAWLSSQLDLELEAV